MEIRRGKPGAEKKSHTFVDLEWHVFLSHDEGNVYIKINAANGKNALSLTTGDSYRFKDESIVIPLPNAVLFTGE